MDAPDADDGVQKFACLICRQRKIKCDRRKPCSTCTKAGQQCDYIAPVRGKRKRTVTPKEGLHAKLHRYEGLLQSNGINQRSIEIEIDTESPSGSTPLSEVVERGSDVVAHVTDRRNPYRLEQSKPVFIAKKGISRYLDSALWSGIRHEFAYEEMNDPSDAINRFSNEENETLLGAAEPEGFPSHDPPYEQDFAAILPATETLVKLQEIYQDRVDPLMKILHLPSFWPSLARIFENPHGLSKSMEAVVLAFLLTVVNTMEERECSALLGSEKSTVFSRYRKAAMQALVKARFLTTLDPRALQAFTMFIMGVWTTYQRDALFMLSGTAIRIARKMGFHRDGAFLGLPPFATEMRRRFWWHLVHIDFERAESLSVRPSLDLFSGDTKMPLNIEDEDFSSGMSAFPTERKGITAVTVCRIRCELIGFLRKFSSPGSMDVRWDALVDSDRSIEEKDRLIGEFEDEQEGQYLRYFDPSNPLHNLISIVVRSSICKMKVLVHNPRLYTTKGIEIPPDERDIIFSNATKLLEYASLIPGNPSLEKYQWQVSISYLCQMLLYVLIEIRHRKTGYQVDRVWPLIGVFLSKYPRIAQDFKDTIFVALRKLILEVWDEHVTARREGNAPEPSIPEYIREMQSIRNDPHTSNELKQSQLIVESTAVAEPQLPALGMESFGGFETFDSYDFSGVLSFEMDPNEWLRWDSLFGEGTGFS